jgi:glycosyltransferase involved in cell wall biosynthesis
MKILWVGPWRSDALCAQVRGKMAQAIHNSGNEVATIVIGDPGTWRTGGYDRVFYCPTPRTTLGQIVNQLRLAAVVARYEGDVIVLGEKVSHLAPVASLIRGVLGRTWSLVLDVRTLPIPTGHDQGRRRNCRFWKSLRIAFRFVDAWMAITPRLRDLVKEKANTRGLTSTIWESAVDEGFPDLEVSEPYLPVRECGHDCNLLYLGSLSRGRRLDLPIRAMAELKSTSGTIGLHIVGSGDDVPELRKLIRQLRLDRVVHLWDPMPYSAVPKLIKACDMGILPLPFCDAWNTSSPLKIFEYLGLGLPVLVSDIPAHRDLLGGQPFAFFMHDYSPGDFNEALGRFLALPQETRLALGSRAREFIRAAHTWSHRARVIDDFLIQLRSGNGSGPLHRTG